MGKQLTLAWLEMYNFSYLEQTTQDAVRHPAIQHESLLQEEKTNL